MLSARIPAMPSDSTRFRFLRMEVWQEGRKLYRLVSSLIRKFPREEAFGLTSQMRRSARSVCANIAEGAGRNSDKDFAQFVEIAYGSAMEIASDSFLAVDEGYITQREQEALLEQIETVAAKASGLYRKLTDGSPPGVQRSALRAPRSAAS
jgi:four helix bundle protein